MEQCPIPLPLRFSETRHCPIASSEHFYRPTHHPLELFRNKKRGRLSLKNYGGSQPMSLHIRDDRQMKALTGLSQAQFDHLLPVFSDMYQVSQQQTYAEGVESGTRMRKPGGGSKGKLPTIADKLLFLLYYFSRPPSKASRGQAKPTPPPRLRWGSPPGSARPNPSSSSIPKKPPSSYNRWSRKPAGHYWCANPGPWRTCKRPWIGLRQGASDILLIDSISHV